MADVNTWRRFLKNQEQTLSVNADLSALTPPPQGRLIKAPSVETMINCFSVGANCVRPPKICVKQVFSGERSSPLRRKCDQIIASRGGRLILANHLYININSSSETRYQSQFILTYPQSSIRVWPSSESIQSISVLMFSFSLSARYMA